MPAAASAQQVYASALWYVVQKKRIPFHWHALDTHRQGGSAHPLLWIEETFLDGTQTAPRIGVLAIQGDYEAHASALTALGARASQVKTPQGLDGLDGLVLPGGESSTMLRFLERDGFFEALQAFTGSKPVFGTCAGAILLAKTVRDPVHAEQGQRSLGALDIEVERNAYGRQNDSAILMLETTLPGHDGPGQDGQVGEPLETVFIRAPRIVATGPEVEVMASRDGFPVLVRQGKTMAATFHPELSADRRVHRFFLELVKAAAPAGPSS
jgi:5'-phosphate synthase pdxT subunit